MKKNLYSIFVIFILLNFIPGCRTLFPKDSEENPQPWAQPEEWQKTQGLPGFSSGDNDLNY